MLKLRFGIGDGTEHTLEEVGRTFNVTRERIRQIEYKALRKLRHPTRAQLLKPFSDGTKADLPVAETGARFRSDCDVPLLDTAPRVTIPSGAHSSAVRAAGS